MEEQQKEQLKKKKEQEVEMHVGKKKRLSIDTSMWHRRCSFHTDNFRTQIIKNTIFVTSL